MMTTDHCSLVKYAAIALVMGAVSHLALATDGATAEEADDAPPG